MDRKLGEEVLRLFLSEIRSRLDEAAKVAHAAVICAESQIPSKGVNMMLEVEDTLFEVSSLLNATTMLNRLANDSD